MPAPTSGLARVTIRAPRRRLDLVVPHQVPLAELLPEMLRRAGETGPDATAVVGPAGGWILRRGDGALLTGEAALAPQGVRDGDVLYLVPRNVAWPEPAYDDVIEEIAAGARARGRTWDAAATRVFAIVAAGLVLLVGLVLLPMAGAGGGAAALGVAAILVLAGGLLSRAAGDGVAGAAVAGFGLPYAATGAALLAGPAAPSGRVLVAACALLLAAVLGMVAVGYGLRVFAGGITVGLFAAAGAILGLVLAPAGAAALVVVAVVAGIGLAPLLAVRLGKLPLPVVTAAAEVIAVERRPDRPAVFAAVGRAEEILLGLLLGVATIGVAAVLVLDLSAGVAPRLLGALVAAALLLRARLFPALAARLPLLVGGLLGLAGTGWSVLAGTGAAVRLAGVATAFVAVVVLLVTAATAQRRRSGAGRSPYLGRLADILDIATVVALAPVACGVLDLYSWVRGLAG